MFGSHRASSALAALVLTACAHGGGGAGSSVYGGRAAQPFGWPESLASSTQAPGPIIHVAAPGGRAAQPFGWPEHLAAASSAPISEAPARAYVGGRAAQPFGWPEQLLEDAQ